AKFFPCFVPVHDLGAARLRSADLRTLQEVGNGGPLLGPLRNHMIARKRPMLARKIESLVESDTPTQGGPDEVPRPSEYLCPPLGRDSSGPWQVAFQQRCDLRTLESAKRRRRQQIM